METVRILDHSADDHEMSPSHDIFRDDYNLDALERIRPRGHAFEMLVTPRFLGHYVEERYERLTTNLIRSICARKQIFIDVGANYGFFPIVAGTRNPDLQIHAIEPIPESFEVLRRNVELNRLSAVKCHQLAASNRIGMATYLKSKASDNSGFHPHPAAPPITEVEIQTLKLSSLLEDWMGAPTLIKIDTEGHEIPVLEGLEDSLSGVDDATLIVEFNPTMQRQAGHRPENLLAMLEDMGFSTFLLMEDEYQLIRLDAKSDWHGLIPPDGAANLYCRPRASALSVCFVSHSHGLAGAERSLVELVGELVEDHGIVCNVVIPGEGPLEEQVEAVGAGVVRAEYGWWCSEEAPTETALQERLDLDLARFLIEVTPQIEAIRPDLISTNSLVIPYGAIVAAILHKPHIWHVHEYGQGPDGYQFCLPFDQIQQFVEDFSDFVITPSRTLGKNLFPHFSEDRIDYLYPHIQAPELADPGEAAQTATASRPLRLVDLATLTAAKQLETDLRAVGELRQRGHIVSLLLKGPQDPEYVARLRQLAASLGIGDQVVFEGFSDDIWPILDRSDVVLVSDPAHSFGRTAAEGMLRGKPVVYPQGTGIDEYMDDGISGMAYSAGDSTGMADQIERLIEHPELRRTIGRKAHEIATRLFTRESFSGKYLERARQLVFVDLDNRPRLPDLLSDSLLAGLRRLAPEITHLEKQFRSCSEELASWKATAEARERETAGMRPVLEAKEAELASIKPFLEVKEAELASIKPLLEAKEKELASVKGVLVDRDRELASIKPILEVKEEEIASIKPHLEARETELAAVRKELTLARVKLTRLLSTRLGRLAARMAKID